VEVVLSVMCREITINGTLLSGRYQGSHAGMSCVGNEFVDYADKEAADIPF
ncbi:hypothetical protein GCK32_021430, partial [Trichostrongylus colubriformis]